VNIFPLKKHRTPSSGIFTGNDSFLSLRRFSFTKKAFEQYYTKMRIVLILFLYRLIFTQPNLSGSSDFFVERQGLSVPGISETPETGSEYPLYTQSLSFSTNFTEEPFIKSELAEFHRDHFAIIFLTQTFCV